MVNQNKLSKLFRNTEGFTKHYVVHEAILNIELITDLIKDSILNAQISHNSDLPLFNFFSNGQRDEDVNTKLLSTKLDDDLLSHVKKVSGYDKYCLILNHIECYSSKFSDYVTKQFTEYIVSNFGEPRGGIDFYAFIGNNDVSPPGIHIDSDLTFIFHLGPGKKKFKIWYNDFEISDLKGSGMTIPNNIYDNFVEVSLKPGSILFLPPRIPHEASYSEPSVMFGITIFPYMKSHGWFYSPSKNGEISEYQENTYGGNKYLKYPEYNNGRLNILPLVFSTSPLKEDIRKNLGNGRDTLKPVYKNIWTDGE